MSVTLYCPGCGKKLTVPDNRAGRRLSCPSCHAPLNIPAEETKVDLEEIPELDDVEVLDDEPENSDAHGISARPTRPPAATTAQAAASGALGILSLGRKAERTRCLAIHPATHRGLAGCGETIFVLNMDEGKRAFRFEKQRAPVTSLAISPDGRQVLSGDQYGGLALWEIRSGHVLRRLAGHHDEVTAVAFSPNGQYAVSGGSDGDTRLWELETGEEYKLYQARWDGPVKSVAFSPDGRRVLAAGSRVCVWSVKTSEPLFRARTAGDAVSAAFARDGETFAACRPSTSSDTGLKVRRWESATGKSLPCFENPIPNRTSVVLAAVVPGTLRIISTGKKGARRPDGRNVAGAVGASILGTVAMNAVLMPFGMSGYVAFRPGYSHYDPSDPYCIQVWSIGTGGNDSYDAGKDPPIALAVSADGTRAITATRNNFVQLWGLPL
jgi:WD40 repeat protein